MGAKSPEAPVITPVAEPAPPPAVATAPQASPFTGTGDASARRAAAVLAAGQGMNDTILTSPRGDPSALQPTAARKSLLGV